MTDVATPPAAEVKDRGTTVDQAAAQAAADAIATSAAQTHTDTGGAKTPEQRAADAAAAQAGTTTGTQTPIEYTLALPKDAVIEASAVERATAFAKAEKLTPDAAQKALDFVNTEVAADRVRQETASQVAFKVLARETWVAELKADPTFGGEQYLTTVEDVTRASARFLTAEERELLNVTGWGNHPMLCKMFARIGQALANDKLLMGGGSGSGERDNSMEGRASRMYVNDGRGPMT